MITYKSKYNVDPRVAISPSELKDLYLYGIHVRDKEGRDMPDSAISRQISMAQSMLENYLQMKLYISAQKESVPYYKQDFDQQGFIKVSYPARIGYELEGWLGQQKQVTYIKEWMVTRTDSNQQYYRHIHLVPVGNTTGQSALFTGLMPYIGYRGASNIPAYWHVTYTTGISNIPSDILSALGKIAAIMVLHQLGDIVLGVGVGNMSLSLDGLSQSIGTTKNSGGAFGGRIKSYSEELKVELANLKDFYTGFKFISL